MSDYYIDENGVIDGFTNKRVEKTGNFFNITEQILSLSNNDYIVKYENHSNKPIWVYKKGVAIWVYFRFSEFLSSIEKDIRIWEGNEVDKITTIKLTEGALRDMSLD